MGDKWSTSSGDYGSKSSERRSDVGCRRSVTPDLDTYKHIFGDEPAHLKRKQEQGNFPHISSDITRDREPVHYGSLEHQDEQYIQGQRSGQSTPSPTSPRSEGSPQFGGKYSDYYVDERAVKPAESQERMYHHGAGEPLKQDNVRDYGSVPYRGQEYSEEFSPSKSHRRHFPQTPSRPFW